ncbi:uncharacterized protein LOC110177766 [Drosophila serrata]|uniref:uncharacterized protein LOC110177766 n=1 Tax=Drosophila serrata TaxID=7274 RepID=UPI000A1D2BE1|nr:uncharacterized protein LOC110177766 [Drosophila serrata]
MVAQLPVIILLSLTWFSKPLQAVIKGNINVTLIDSMATHLSGSPVALDTWSKEMSLVLEKEQQERLAWNVPWFKILQEERVSLVELQNQLKPNNSLKLRLWLSFYWHLRRSQTLNKILLANFALELRDLRRHHPHMWSYYLQNMLQSLPPHLRILAQSRWLCLQHKREMFYVSTGYHLELGANDHCDLWRIQDAQKDYFLLLVNSCREERYFLINISEDYQGSYQLLRPTNYMNNTFCVLRGLAYFRETSQVSESDLSCRWQLNDCSYLPTRLLGERELGENKLKEVKCER